MYSDLKDVLTLETFAFSSQKHLSIFPSLVTFLGHHCLRETMTGLSSTRAMIENFIAATSKC